VSTGIACGSQKHFENKKFRILKKIVQVILWVLSKYFSQFGPAIASLAI